MSATDSVAVRGSDEQEAAEQRSALLRRVAVAGGLIAMLIGGLALFDASRRAPEVDDEPVAEAAPPARADTPAAEEATALPTLPPEETPAVDATTASLQDTPPPLPDAGSAAEAPASPAAAEPTVPESTARPGAPAPARSAAPATPPSRPATAAAEPASAAPPPAPAITRAPAVAGSGYVVQVGVFSNVANAEEVRARLALNGIPSQIEARVHIGPFKTRAEADQARVRLRALGMDSGAPAALRPAAAPR